MLVQAAVATAELSCKGTHALQIRSWVEQRRGPGSFQKLLALEGGQGAAWEHLVIGGWYDAQALLGVIERAAAEEGVSVETAVEEIARMNARADLKTVYRVFLKIVSPLRVVGLLPRIWQQYFRFGHVEVQENRHGYAELVTSSIPSRFVPWVVGGWRGFLTETLLAAGAHQPRILNVRVASQAGVWSVRVTAEYGAPD